MPSRKTNLLIAFVILTWALVTALGYPMAPKAAKDLADELFERLLTVDRSAENLCLDLNQTKFLPFQSSVGRKCPEHFDALKSLVALGRAAIPSLLNHLDDNRPTRLVISSYITFAYSDGLSGRVRELDDLSRESEHTVRIGDLCYLALGQIVNKDYAVVRAFGISTCVLLSPPKSPLFCKKIREQWARLTDREHRELLGSDLCSDGPNECLGAAYRLQFYYPDHLEVVIKKVFQRPYFDGVKASHFLGRQLYKASDAIQRRRLLSEFLRLEGGVYYEGILTELFDDLSITTEKDEAKELLVNLFGFSPSVTVADKPAPVSQRLSSLCGVIDALERNSSKVVDASVLDLLSKNYDYQLGLACMRHLRGRGFDDDIRQWIEEYKRRTKMGSPADIEEMSNMLGWTPLHLGAAFGSCEAVEQVLANTSHHVDVNRRTHGGLTALYVAVQNNNIEVIDILLKKGADPNISSRAKMLPISLAVKLDNSIVAKRLHKAGAKITSATDAVSADADEDLLRIIQALPESILTKPQDDFSLLHYAASRGCSKALQTLLDFGFDVNCCGLNEVVSRRGITPLHSACTGKETQKIVIALLQRGAKVNGVANSEETPLHTAVRFHNLELIKILLLWDADKSLCDRPYNRTPYELARMSGYQDVIKLLK